MRISINPHVQSVKESATLAINQRARQLRAEGKEIFHFGFGQSPFPVPQAIQSALRDHVSESDYLPTRGLPALRERIAGFYQRECGYQFTPDQICVGPGSKELIFQSIYLLQGPLIIPAPSWVSYGPQAALRGKDIITVETSREHGYRLQAEELERACHRSREDQKILIFNNPSNPTGSSHSDEEIKELAAVCRSQNVIVISDEIYGLLDFSGNRHTSIAHHYPEGTIVTGGLSKAFSAGGYRLGVVLIPEELSQLLEAMMVMISETFSAVAAPIQHAACVAYEYKTEIRQEVERARDIHQFTSLYLHSRFETMRLNCPRPAGGFYLFPDFNNVRAALNKRGIATGQQLVETVLEETGVVTLPASAFYLPDSHLGVRVASVDYNGTEVLDEFPGSDQMNAAQTKRLFPNLVKGCDKLESFLNSL